jgi:DNA-binding GntR family transcriptional regulator
MAAKKSTVTQAQSIQEKAYLFVRKKIASGELQPGAILSEASIARELGNSRGPLREAIRQLTAEGFLRQNPNRSCVVTEFSRRDIAELYELREALEVYAVGQAAAHAPPPDEIGAFQSLVDEVTILREDLLTSGERRLNAAQMRRFVQNDLNFHNLLVRAAANRRILKVFADTRVLLHIFAMRRKGHDAALLKEIHRYHSDIVSAVAAGDSATAMRLLGEHIRVSKEERLKEYDEREREIAMHHPLLDLDGRSE